jgi:hypothetical protein
VAAPVAAPPVTAAPYAAPAQQYAAPAAYPPAPAVAAPPQPVAAPAVHAPAAPVMPSPTTPPGAGPRGAEASGKRAKGAGAQPQPKSNKFRETMWFKKGELDAAAAEAAAEVMQAKPDEIVADRADDLPMEDRYKDDGSITAQDQRAFSLRTGHTQMMQAVDPRRMGPNTVGEDELVSEMKAGRGKIVLIIAIVALALAAMLGWYFTSGRGEHEPAKPATTTPAAETPPTGAPR